MKITPGIEKSDSAEGKQYLVIEWSEPYKTWLSSDREERASVLDALEHATWIGADHDAQPRIEVYDDVDKIEEVEAALDECDVCLHYRWVAHEKLVIVAPEDTYAAEEEHTLLHSQDDTFYIAG